MGIILLLVILVIAAIEAVIGVRRGIALTGVRVATLLVGTIISAILAKPIAKLVIGKVVGASGGKGSSLADMMADVLGSTGLGANASVFGVPLAALMLSASIPVAFALLFVIFKLVTWLIFIPIAIVLKKTKFAPVFTERPNWSKGVGGLVGAVIGIYSCAVLAMPVTGLINTVDKSGAGATVGHIVAVMMDKDTAARVASSGFYQMAMRLDETGALGLGAIGVYAAGMDESNVVMDIYDMISDSAASMLLTVTGAELVSDAIYSGTSDVSPDDVGAAGYATENFNFPEAVGEVLGVAEEIDKAVTMISDGEAFSSALVDSAQNIVMYALESNILADENKLDMVNAAADVLNETINEAMGLDGEVTIFRQYESIAEIKEDVTSICEVAKVVTELDLGGDLTNVDVNKLLGDTALMQDFVSKLFKLPNGADILAGIANQKVAEFSKGQFTDVVSINSLTSISEEAIAETITTMMNIADYLNRNVLDDADKDFIRSQIDRVEALGVLSPSTISVARDALGEK